MFKIADHPEFTHNVPVQVPIDGGHREDMLTTRFRAISLSEGDDYDLATKEGTTGYLQTIIVRFENLADLEGTKIECTDLIRDQLIDKPYIRTAIITGYTRAMHKARLGN